VPLQSQRQADLLGGITALKAMGKLSSLEVVTPKVKKEKFLELSMVGQ